MKRKVTMVGISGDEPTLLPGEGDMMSSRKILFPSNSMSTRQGRIFSPYALGHGVYFLHLCLLTFAIHFFPLAVSGAPSIMSLHPFCLGSRSP